MREFSNVKGGSNAPGHPLEITGTCIQEAENE